MSGDQQKAGEQPWRSGLRWLGILAAALWMFEAITGVLLTYHFDINDKLLAAEEIALDYDAIEQRIDTIESAGEQAKVNWMWSTAGMTGRFLMNYTDADGSAHMARIAGDGSILLDTAEDEFTTFEYIRALHLELAAGDVGEWILAIAGIILLINLVLALKDAWPHQRSWRDALNPNAVSAGVSPALARFRAITLWGAIPAFIVVLAAVVIFFEHQIEGPIGAPPHALEANAPDGPGVGFAAAARAAETAIPGSSFVGTTMPTADDASYNAWVNQPGEYFRDGGYGGSLAIINANDGSVRAAWPLQEASVPYKAIALPYPIHTGEIAGPLGRFLVLLTGFWLLVWASLKFQLLRKASAQKTSATD